MARGCSACGAELIWAISPTGAPSPIDVEVTETGNVLLLHPRGLEQTLAITLSKDGLDLAREQGLPLHTSHFSSCPNREEFKR